MSGLDRITFVTQHKDEEFEFSNAYLRKKDSTIIIYPISYPHDDVRGWDIVASKDGDVKVTGRITGIEEKTTTQSRHGRGETLEIHYLDKL